MPHVGRQQTAQCSSRKQDLTLDQHPYVVCTPLQVRYNAVRRQTAAKAGEKEFQVLDYQNTSADLLPLVASSYALIFMVRRPSAIAQRVFLIEFSPG